MGVDLENFNDSNFLFSIIQTNQKIEVIEKVLEEEYLINSTNNLGDNSLLIEISKDCPSLEIVELLLRKKASIFNQKKNRSAFHMLIIAKGNNCE